MAQVVPYDHAMLCAAVQRDLMSVAGNAWHPATLSAYRENQTRALTVAYVDHVDSSIAGVNGLRKFVAAEERCRVFNQVIQGRKPRQILTKILAGAAHYIERALGPLRSVDIVSACQRATVGSGSCVGRQGQENRLNEKLRGFKTATASTKQFVRMFVRANPGWVSRMTTFPYTVHTDRLFFVPKKADEFRIAGAQPDFNLALQLGVGRVIADRVKRYFGADIYNRERGWECARMGSIYGNYATMDLSSASDLLCWELVRALLPSDWFELLNSLRVTHYSGLAEGRYEKFSAMGNGFTFPLQTMVFNAIIWAVQDLMSRPHFAIVFGDDIVIPSRDFDAVAFALEECGLKVNWDKSFFDDTPFRETCGVDYHNGVDIRPIEIDGPCRRPNDVYLLHNRFLLNRQGFPYPRTLAYLRSLAPNGLVQPPYYGAGDAWRDWEPWLNTVLSGAFIVGPDDHAVPAETFNHRLQRMQRRFRVLTYRRSVWKTSSEEDEVVNWEPDLGNLSASLLTGEHTEYLFRRGHWKLVDRSCERWYSLGDRISNPPPF